MLKKFRPKIRSRHPSHEILRGKNKTLPLLPYKSVIRFGSTTILNDVVSLGGDRIEVNTIQAVKNSMNKFMMKTCFTNNEVKTADWWAFSKEKLVFPDLVTEQNVDELPFPVIVKKYYGSRNEGNTKIDTLEAFKEWLENNKNKTSNYIVEKFYNFSREYRIHVTQKEAFYTCRKMLKADTPDEHKWYRNDEHCVWILEENPLFDKPINWDTIVQNAINAASAVGLDIGAVDVKVQSANNNKGKVRENPDFIIIEINSAPSFGEITAEKYKTQVVKVIEDKAEKLINII